MKKITILSVLMLSVCSALCQAKTRATATWVSGSNKIYNYGVYGTKGTAHSDNVPGGRHSSISWTDSSGNLWLFGGWGHDGVAGYGGLNDLWKFDGTNWTTYNVTSDPIIPDNNIQAIFIDSDDDTWIGTDFGISTYDGTTWTTYTTTDGLGNNQIKCIGQDAAGKMWFGTSNGVSTYDGTTWTNYGTADGIPFGGVNSITLYTNGEVWLGTGLSGVRVFDGTTFDPIQETDGFYFRNRREPKEDQITTCLRIDVLKIARALAQS